MEAVGSYDELLAKPGVTGDRGLGRGEGSRIPSCPTICSVHKPYIDAVTYDSPFAKGARMQRVTEVIDCWYDSGAMPFAQWGYPHAEGSDERFKSQFPADFISEAIDQTRGWFYSQLAISTMMFGEREVEQPRMPRIRHPTPRSSLIPLPPPLPQLHRPRPDARRGRAEDVEEQAELLPPNEIFDKYGADALRWYFFANQPPWTSIRYSEQAIKDSIPEFLLRLWNVTASS